MRDVSWRVDDGEPGPAGSGDDGTGLVSLHFLRSAVRRRWRLWVGLAVTGLLVGLGSIFVLPPTSSATATLLLVHAPDADPQSEMATDVSLLRTRTVASRVIGELDLGMSPEEFQELVTVSMETSTVLLLSVAGPDPAAARERTETLTEEFLRFRTEQLKLQSDAEAEGYQKQLDSLGKQAATLTARYEALSTGGPSGQEQASAVLTQRSQLNSRMNEIRASLEETKLATDAVVGGSHVLDPAETVPASQLREVTLRAASGLVLGAGLGLGLVLLAALTSDRLRRRDEVAVALGVPVRCSVGRLPRRGLGRLLPGAAARRRHLAMLVGLLRSALPRGTRSRLVVGAVQAESESAQLVAALATDLAEEGREVFLVDLSESGHLETLLRRRWTDPERPAPRVHRPKVVPTLSGGPTSGEVAAGVPAHDPAHYAWRAAEVVLTLAEVDPAIGTDHLAPWAERMVLVTAAGRSSAERLRTTAALVRASDLHLPFVVLTGADRRDESLGLTGLVLDAQAATREAR